MKGIQFFIFLFLIILLIPFIENPDCSSHLSISPQLPFFCFFNVVVVDKVTTETKLVPKFYYKIFILNWGTWSDVVTANTIRFLFLSNWRIISKLSNDILKVLQKLYKYFNWTITSTSFVTPFPVRPVICCLNLSKILLLLLAEKLILLLLLYGAVSCLYYYHKLPGVLE